MGANSGAAMVSMTSGGISAGMAVADDGQGVHWTTDVAVSLI
jgi:hypothetical protein